MCKARTQRSQAGTRRRLSAAVLLGTASVLVLSSPAGAQSALPQGASVASGQVSFSNPASNALTITQSSAKAIVNWNSFSVGSNASVNFAQPNANAAILNRVTGSISSTIAGQITGNGQVYLVNPNGIAITPTGNVRVGGGFVASTLDISDADFNAGRLSFSGRGSSAAVSNAGTISGAAGSYVGLIGGSVSNSGTISVPLGKVGLGAGEQVTLDPSGDGFLQVALPTSATAAGGKALLDVSGRIRAAGGRVEIRAAAAQQAARDVVNVSGTVSARSVSGRSGNIVLGGGGGAVTVSGRLAANGGRRHAGGTIVVTGSRVALTETARISANGRSGGKILIGGDQRGGSDAAAKLVGADVQNAQTTTVAQGAVISANGSGGDGGKVVLWSDEFTEFRGTISATGAGTGNGGAVETSSHGVLNYRGTVDVTAQNGRTGTLLLDPYDITISTGSDTTVSNAGGTYSPTANSSILSVATLQTALASANVTVDTGSSGAQSGNITLANALTWSSGNSLSLNAAGAILLNAGITASNGSLQLTGSQISFNSSVNLGGTLTATSTASGANTALSFNGGSIAVGAGSSTVSGTSSTGYGALLAGNTSLTTTGGGTLVVGGTNTGSTTTAATDFAPGANLTTAGSVSLNSTSSSYIGMEFEGNNTVTASSGNLTFSGHATSDAGLQLRGTVSIVNSGVGALGLNGTTSSYRGLDFFSGSTVTVSGNAALAGISSTGTGAFFGSSFDVTGGNVSVNGTSTATTGTGATIGLRLASATVRNSGSGTLSLTGTSNDSGATTNSGSVGALMTGATALSNTGAGSFTVTGLNTSGYGTQIKSGASITTSGAIAIAGQSGAGDGVNVGSTTSITDQSGDLTVTATSTSGTSLNLASGTVTLVNAGAGAMSLAGTSAASAQYGIAIASNLTTSGNITVTGNNTNAAYGLYLNGTTITDNAGNLTLNGTASNNNAVWIQGNTLDLVNNSAGTLQLTGTTPSATGRGVRFNTGANLTTSGTVTVHGTSSGSDGLSFKGSNTITIASGTPTLSGTSTSGNGVYFQGSATIDNQTGAAITFAGTSSSGYGLKIENGANLTSHGAVQLSGTSASGLGLVAVGGDTLTAASGALSLSGTSSSTDGINLTSGGSIGTSGAVSMTGTSTSGTGLVLNGVNTITDSAGNLTLAGLSTSGHGAFLAGTSALTNAGAGTFSLTGTSTSSQGFVVSGATVTTSGNIGISGTSNSGVAIYFLGANAISSSAGNATWSGTSQSNHGVWFNSGSSSLVNSGAGTLGLSGSSSSFSGIAFNGATSLSLSGGVNMSGSSASDAGLYWLGSNALTIAGGAPTIAGTSTTGAGISLASMTVDNQTGSAVTLAGNSTSGSGLTIGNGASLTTIGGGVQFSGSSSSGSGLVAGGSNAITMTSGALTLSGATSSGAAFGYDMSASGTTITNNGAGVLTLAGSGGGKLGATITSNAAPVVLTGTGTVTQTGGAVTTTGLKLSGSASYALNANNLVGTLAASGIGSLGFSNAQALTIGTVQGTTGISASGAATVLTTGNLTLASGAIVSATSPVLSTALAFINNAGANAVTATSGRWLIYSSAPGSDSFGSLNSGNTAIWNATYASLPPASVTASGNRYLFAMQPTLTFSPISFSKTYGADATATLATSYGVSGYQSGAANAFLGDAAATAFTGVPSLTSGGAAATAGVAGSPYAINVAQGSLASAAGYAFGFGSGALSVTPAQVMVRPLGGTSVIGVPSSDPGLAATGLQNGESVSVLTGLSSSYGITPWTPLGSYALTVAGTQTNPNYVVAATSSAVWRVTVPDMPNLAPSLRGGSATWVCTTSDFGGGPTRSTCGWQMSNR
ncbi:beta strand repeat-containing protein [Bradyrhizobium sp. HKCCYLS20291]|uniref:beta strand repeat-containing protein n=1 Tax=Bradyrhizobium sp. HKCCYLS20291 TaxID=3420766 RepID=UPI003EBE33AD